MSANIPIDLLCQLTRTISLQELCDLAYQITGNPVFVADMAHTILAYTKCVDIPDEIWQQNIVAAHLERNSLRQDREIGYVHAGSAAARYPVLVEDSHMPYQRIIKSLVHEGRAVGVLVLTTYCTPLSEHDLELVELIGAFVLPSLVRERYQLSSDNRSVENYLIKLLDGAVFTREQVDAHLRAVGYKFEPCIYVLTMCVTDIGEDDCDEGGLEQLKRELGKVLNCRSFLYNSLLVCVYHGPEQITHWPDQVPGLDRVMQRWGLIAGVSRQLTSISNLREGYLQAQAVLEKGRLLKRQYRCYRFDSFSGYLMFDRIPPIELESYCNEQILHLAEYDQLHESELCITLQVYLEQAKSLARAAEILYVHRNTVRYRINRCIEILGNEMEDASDIFSYILSLRILEYKRKIHPVMEIQTK